MTKKKVALKVAGRKCINCIFHVPATTKGIGALLGRCHRYPLASKCRPDHWCGEYKQR